MPTIHVTRADMTTTSIQTESGLTLMQVAKNNFLDEILAECGGAGACATCHCYIDSEWYHRLPPPDETERSMLTIVAEPKQTSRLSCQIVVSDEMDGLSISLPASQY